MLVSHSLAPSAPPAWSDDRAEVAVVAMIEVCHEMCSDEIETGRELFVVISLGCSIYLSNTVMEARLQLFGL